ncbi:MAG: hypothetical protein WD598_08185 [Acidimicrobiia bacterium]
MADSYGIDVERWLREVAAHHGVADFVFRSVNVSKGKAKREVGDFLLWVGDVVAIISSKSREPAAAARETQERRRKWFNKQITDAYDEIIGVARTLKSAAAGTIVLESERGVRVPWDPGAITDYVGVVLVHAAPPEDDLAPPIMNNAVPAIAMLADDWDFLNQVLPSTMSVIRYLGRRLRYIPACPMGAESAVLALILEHESTGTPISIPHLGLPKDHFARVATEHPDWFLGGDPDDHFSFVISAMIEGAADADPHFSDTADPRAYMRIVEFLDRIPLLNRVTIGRAVIERCQRVGSSGGRIASRFVVPHGMLIFVTDDADRADRAEYIKHVTFARHSQALDGGAPESLMTLGIGTEPIPTDGRSHDFVMIQGGIQSDSDFRTRRDELFQPIDVEPMLEYWATQSP